MTALTQQSSTPRPSGLFHVFVCRACRSERVYGTAVNAAALEPDETNTRPSIDCVTCGPARPHLYAGPRELYYERRYRPASTTLRNEERHVESVRWFGLGSGR